jgi:hypothetical protein
VLTSAPAVAVLLVQWRSAWLPWNRKRETLERMLVKWNDKRPTNSALSFRAKVGNPVLLSVWGNWVAPFAGDDPQ